MPQFMLSKTLKKWYARFFSKANLEERRTDRRAGFLDRARSLSSSGGRKSRSDAHSPAPGYPTLTTAGPGDRIIAEMQQFIQELKKPEDLVVTCHPTQFVWLNTELIKIRLKLDLPFWVSRITLIPSPYTPVGTTQVMNVEVLKPDVRTITKL